LFRFVSKKILKFAVLPKKTAEFIADLNWFAQKSLKKFCQDFAKKAQKRLKSPKNCPVDRTACFSAHATPAFGFLCRRVQSDCFGLFFST
jgi:hypothetical protein